MGILFFILLPQDPCYSKWLELAVLVSPEAWDRNSGTGQTYWICIVTRSPGYIKDGEALPECLNISHSSHQKTPVRIEPLFPNLKAEIKLSNIFKVKQPVKNFWLQVYSKEKKITSLLWAAPKERVTAVGWNGNSWGSESFPRQPWPSCTQKKAQACPRRCCNMFQRSHLKAVQPVQVFRSTHIMGRHTMPCGFPGWQHIPSLCTPEEHGLDGHPSNQSSSALKVIQSWQPQQGG